MPAQSNPNAFPLGHRTSPPSPAPPGKPVDLDRLSHWYPQADRLKTPESLASQLKQVLDQFYALQDEHDALKRQVTAMSTDAAKAKTDPPPGSGPADSMLLGLRVAPVDVDSLADGTTLTFVKSNGNFQFL